MSQPEMLPFSKNSGPSGLERKICHHNKVKAWGSISDSRPSTEISFFFPLFLHFICHRWCCCSFSAPTDKCIFAHLDLATHLQQRHKGLSYYLQLSITLIASVASRAIDYRQDESPSFCRHGCFRISMEKFHVTDQNWEIFQCVKPKDKEKSGEWHCCKESNWTWGIVNNIRSAPCTHTPTPTPSQLQRYNISFWALLHGMRKLWKTMHHTRKICF